MASGPPREGVLNCTSLSDSQEKLLHEYLTDFAKLASSSNKDIDNINLLRQNAVRFLNARKWDVKRAIELYKNYERFRQLESLNSINPAQDGVRRELLSEKFTILETRDSSGAAIAVFTARRHWPLLTTHKDTLKGLIMQLDAATMSMETQKNGLVLIYDMSDSKYSNFDYDLSTKILNMLQGTYPARLRMVLIVTAPLWFRAPFQVLRLFVREKLRDRVFTVDRASLTRHISKESLPRHLGGTCNNYDHRGWLRSALNALNLNEQLSADWFQPKMTSSLHCTSSATISDADTLSSFNGFESSRSSSYQTDLYACNLESSQSKRLKVDHVVTTVTAVRLSDSRRQEEKSCTSVHGPDSGGGYDMDLFMEHVGQLGREGLIAEYMQNFSGRGDQPCTVFKKPCNKEKNRYIDVPCIDATRVYLKSSNTGAAAAEGHSDYIHANWVDSYRQSKAFICTQGPLASTVTDFWRMVWQYKVPVLVMTTRQFEGRRVKCHQYWPLVKGSSENYGCGFTVINNSVQENKNFITTQLILREDSTGLERNIIHFQFISWPDYGVPPTAAGFLHFLGTVRDTYRSHLKMLDWPDCDECVEHEGCLAPPIIVHCSAGIGRTGTFITMDILTKRLADVGTVNVLETVRRLRAQRAGSIQMPEQYVFVHLALLEHASQQGLLNPQGLPDDSENEEEDEEDVDVDEEEEEDDNNSDEQINSIEPPLCEQPLS